MKLSPKHFALMWTVAGVWALGFLIYAYLEWGRPGTSVALAGEGALSTCQSCHQVSSPEHDAHAPFDCTTCHLGNPTAQTAAGAHHGMVVIPGNLEDAARTCGACHAQEVDDIHHSLMTTNAGLVAVNRFVFGEQATPDGDTPITAIGHSPADDHLRNLCASCHLGNPRTEFGVIDDASRGGGCNACHLNYDAAAQRELAAYLVDATVVPRTHPTLDLNIDNIHCTGCHSRSGRIAMNYEGWHETQLAALPTPGATPVAHRQLQDGRVFRAVSADVHHTAGLSCVDCHTYADVMGDGQRYLHEEQAVKLQCTDCHRTEIPAGTAVTDLPALYQRLHRMRDFTHERVLETAQDGIPLVNTYVPGDGRAFLIGKADGGLHPLKAPSGACAREFGHQTLDCASCHSAWAPQCTSCHTEYDPQTPAYDLLANVDRTGAWIERAGDFRATLPPLGVSEQPDGVHIQPAVPGMIMTLDRSGFAAKVEGVPVQTFHRLFAPASPHTTAKAGRDCRSCHNEPVALGYGSGRLSYDPTAAAGARWRFVAEHAVRPEDGLPEDAWIGFLQVPREPASTRTDFRPFTIPEQQRILTVGACLECHDQGSERMQATLHTDFGTLVETLPPDCVLPFTRPEQR